MNDNNTDQVPQPDSRVGFWVVVVFILTLTSALGGFIAGEKNAINKHSLNEIGQIAYTNGPVAKVYWCSVHARQEIIVK